jgi:predicted Zn-dependent peptidase
MRAGYILGLESTSSRMSAMGRRLLLQGAPQSEEEVLQRIDGITYEKACEAGRAALSAQPALALVGRDL